MLKAKIPDVFKEVGQPDWILLDTLFHGPIDPSTVLKNLKSFEVIFSSRTFPPRSILGGLDGHCGSLNTFGVFLILDNKGILLLICPDRGNSKEVEEENEENELKNCFEKENEAKLLEPIHLKDDQFKSHSQQRFAKERNKIKFHKILFMFEQHFELPFQEGKRCTGEDC